MNVVTFCEATPAWATPAWYGYHVVFLNMSRHVSMTYTCHMVMSHNIRSCWFSKNPNQCIDSNLKSFGFWDMVCVKSVIQCIDENVNWIEQGLTFHQTHYRSYRGRVFTGQMTQPTVSNHWRKIRPTDYGSIPSGPPHHAHNNTKYLCTVPWAQCDTTQSREL